VEDAQKAVYEIKKARSLALDYQRQYMKSNDTALLLSSSNQSQNQNQNNINEVEAYRVNDRKTEEDTISKS